MQLLNEIALIEQFAIAEQVKVVVGTPLVSQLEQVSKQFCATSKALDILKSSLSPADQERHKQRILMMLTSLQPLLLQLNAAIETEIGLTR